MATAKFSVVGLCLCFLSWCDAGDGQLGVAEQAKPTQSSESDEKPGRDGVPEEPEPTSPISDFDSSYNYILSRLAAMDQAIHQLSVGHYTLDIKVSQLLDKVSGLDGKIGETDDALRQAALLGTENRKEIGRLEGCLKGHRAGHKCYLAYRLYESYDGASQRCQERGGRLAMPRDRREQEALADYVHGAFAPGNWPAWLGVNDRRSEGLYLFEDGTRVTYFQWRKHFLSGQPDGGRRENCVALASDDGDWWDNYCDRRMYYLCEFDA